MADIRAGGWAGVGLESARILVAALPVLGICVHWTARDLHDPREHVFAIQNVER